MKLIQFNCKDCGCFLFAGADTAWFKGLIKPSDSDTCQDCGCHNDIPLAPIEDVSKSLSSGEIIGGDLLEGDIPDGAERLDVKPWQRIGEQGFFCDWRKPDGTLFQIKI